MSKKLISLSLACVLFLLAGGPAFAAVLTPPEQQGVTGEDIDYANSVWSGISWDATRAKQYNELVLSLPRVNDSYIWSVERDVGNYVGIRVQWKLAYEGAGGQDIIIKAYEDTGYYINLLKVDSGTIVAIDTYIYFTDSGLNYIPPEKRVVGAIDDTGKVVGYYDEFGKQVVVNDVYSPFYPDRYIVFAGLDQNHWAYSVIYKLAVLGYIKGYPDGSFKPEYNITRAEFSAIMAQLLKDKYPDGATNYHVNIFKNYPNTHWSYKATYETISYMTKTDVENIFGAMFSPDQCITREEVVAVIHATLKNSPKFQEYFARNISFSDSEKSSFEASINFCAAQGFLAGYPDGTFKPKNNITRAEITAVLSKVVDKL